MKNILKTVPPCSGDEHCEGAGGGVTNIMVEVMRLDHGDTACLSLRNVGYLTPDMAVLPLQAARVSLASVSRPPHVVYRWKLLSLVLIYFIYNDVRDNVQPMYRSLLRHESRQSDAGVLNHLEGVYFAIMTRSLYIILLITRLLTKEFNHLTK